MYINNNIKKIKDGDIFSSTMQTLVNPVNCVGLMGKGLAYEFKIRYPEMFEDYKLRCARHEVALGEPYIYHQPDGHSIINFPTKRHWKSNSLSEDIDSGLEFVLDHLEEWGVTSIALPALGCGLGKLDWNDMEEIFNYHLVKFPIPVELYLPLGIR